MTDLRYLAENDTAAVITVVAEYHGIRPETLRQPSSPRRQLCHVLDDLLGLSLVEIGRALGGVDHSSVRNDLASAARAYGVDMQFTGELGEIRERAGRAIADLTRRRLAEGGRANAPLALARQVLAAPHGEVTISGAEVRLLAEAYLDQLVARLGAAS